MEKEGGGPRVPTEIEKWQKNVPEKRHMVNCPLGKWYPCPLNYKF